jgi:hypothetical protein
MMIFSFGDYKGVAVSDAPDYYLEWILERLRTFCAEIERVLAERRKQGVRVREVSSKANQYTMPWTER